MSLDKITSDSLATGAVNVSALPDGVISAAKLHTTAIQDKLGYTPASANNPTFTGTITFAGQSGQQIVFDRTMGDNWIGSSVVIENGNISVFEPPTGFLNWLNSLEAGDTFTIQPGGQEVTVASTSYSQDIFLVTTVEVIDETPGQGLQSSFWITSLTQDSSVPPDILIGSTPLGSLATKDTVSSSEINNSSITSAKIANGAVTSTKLASGVAIDNIGYTPMNRAAPIFGYATNAWQLLDTTQYGQYAITRKVKEFGSGTLDVCKFRINYGWGSYFFRMTTLEWGYLGGTMRQSSINQIGTGTQVVSGAYSPWWFYNGSSNSQHTHTYYSPGATGGGTDVGWYDVTARVVVPAYTSVQVVIEFGLLGETSSISAKGQIQLY